jgi:gas vesicle protein
MSTKKSKRAVAKNKFNTAIDTTKMAFNNTKNVAKKVNGFALNTTEEVVTESLTAVSQWQEVANKALKGGFKLTANQQDIFFDTLDTFKAQFLQGRKKFHKLFA